MGGELFDALREQFRIIDSDNTGYISEIRWLRAWANQVRSNRFELDFVRRFVESFARCQESTNMKVLLQCEYVTKFPVVFRRVTSWKKHAQIAVSLRKAEEEWQKDRAIRELTGKVDQIKKIMAPSAPR